MAKKNKKKSNKDLSPKKLKKNRQKFLSDANIVSADQQALKSDNQNHPKKESKEIIPTSSLPPKTVTTFSKKLEEAIAETSGMAKKGLLKGKIILLGAPGGTAEEDWKGLWKNFLHYLRLFLTVLIIVGLASSAVVTIELLADQHVFPKVVFAGQDLGLQSFDDAKSNLIKRFDDYQQSSLTFIYGEQQVSIPLKDLSIQLKQEQSISQLPYFQFSKNNLLTLLEAGLTEKEFAPIFQSNDQKIFNQVQDRLGLNKSRAQAARFNIVNKKLQIQPEAAGLIINHADLMEQISDRLKNLNNSPIQIKTLKELPAVTSDELARFQSDLQVKLENQLTLKYQDYKWVFKPTNHLEDIDFRKDNNQVTILISPKLIDDFFQKEVFATIEKAVSHIKITLDDKGAPHFDGKAQNGLTVNHEQFMLDLNMAINSLDQDITLQTIETKSTVDIDPVLQAQGIKEIIGIGHTAFAGSPSNRRTNIEVGMKKFNGVIIKPGQTFSFNDILGPVDASTGYKLELVIKAEGTVPEYGGGICQVSSTMFKAALFSGMPIVERAPHSYAVGYYAQIDGYGLDSTIYPGVRDLKFTNNSPGSILIQTYIEGSDAYINFFGTSDGRQTKIDNYWRGNYRGAGGTVLIPTTTIPAGSRKQIETAHGGFDASWNRTITTKDGKSTTEKIYSVYRSTSNRFLVGQ